ncbi:MAG TPA: Asp-tRNA(Asn)/Glu-tRNA(Gln) amidotransferase subunit GatC [Gemmatimonadaceae bacterium]|nr:Asp-tRNA(Asn)/Glu-tRNA(Gln) amidotransferase subunit GatC [Gemmatimonadaceae bacterium]
MAAQVTIAEVRHVAALARLGLTEERAAELTRDLNTILGHMDVLSRVATKGVAAAAASGAAMRLAPDKGPSIPLMEPLSAFAPAMKDGLIQVPRLSTHELADS